MSEYFKTLSGDDLADIARLLDKPVRMPLDYDDFHIYHKTCRNLLAEVRRLTTALENARKDAWQPIETAPKDGTLVLVAEQGFVEVSHWHVWRLVRPAGASGVGAWVAPKSLPEGEYEIFQPTHWQPLPEPPSLTPPKEKAT